MTLTKEVNKFWPQLAGDDLFSVGVEVVLKEDGVEVRRQTFMERTSKNGDVTLLSAAILQKAQAWIDTYKTEKAAFNSAKYGTLKTNIDAGIVL